MSEPASRLHLGPIAAAAPGPLYQQIVDGVKREVAAQRLAPGDAMPSFRVLAEQLAVSLITVKRAYEELEREGIIFRRQGLGTFVAELGHDRTRDAQREVALRALQTAARAGQDAGMTQRELLQLLREALDIKETGHERRRG